jgi:sec-independent protein translocase protein TatA
MGFGGVSFWQLLIILVIVMLLFGTKRLSSLGSDLGNAIKGFRNAMREGEQERDKLEQKPEEKVVNEEPSRKDKV